jgi:hypothetical protein
MELVFLLELKRSSIFEFVPITGEDYGQFQVTSEFYLYRGKLKRIIAQFGPHSWIEFEWKPTSSWGRWVATLGITFAVIFIHFYFIYFCEFEKFI